MSTKDIIERLKEAEPALRHCGIGALYLFGSHARGEAKPDSDVDVFVDPEPSFSFGFLPYMNAYDVLRAAVGSKVDYGTRAGLHPGLKSTIEREAIRIF